MALSTQVMLLSLVILADSYLFAFDLYDGHDHHRIPLGLPTPLELPGIYRTPRPMLQKDSFRERPIYPYTSDTTTPRKDPIYKVTTSAPTTTTEEIEEITSREQPDIEREVFLMKNVKVPDSTTSELEDKNKIQEANSLPLETDRQMLGNTLHITDPEIISEFVTTEPNVESRNTDTNNRGLTSNKDVFVVPVNAVDPETILNPVSNSRPEKNTPTPFANNGENVNAVPYSKPTPPQNPYTNNNNLVSNSAPNSYTLVPINNPMPNNYYLQPSSTNPQLFNLVPVNSMPVGTNQPNIVSLLNNPPNSFIPLSNNQPNNLVSINNQGSNVIPFNSASNSFVPLNNNQPSNFVPLNNQPGSVITYNNIPNNLLPLNNQPNNYVPANNVLVPVNNNYGFNNNNNAVSSSNQPLVLLNGVLYATQPLNNNQPNNYVSYSNVPNNNVPNNVIALNPNVPNTNLPNVVTLTPNNNLPSNVVSFLTNNNVPTNAVLSNNNNDLRPAVAVPANNNAPTYNNNNVPNRAETTTPSDRAPNNIVPDLNLPQPTLGDTSNTLGDTKDLEEEDIEPAIESGKEESDE